ncbi:MAG: hypothetical protein EAZ24_14105 [Burkholderiales bacterium]|nr:MAG: hypothetical protein EAZ24_14105 [Burkholderiales bacterium]
MRVARGAQRARIGFVQLQLRRIEQREIGETEGGVERGGDGQPSPFDSLPFKGRARAGMGFGRMERNPIPHPSTNLSTSVSPSPLKGEEKTALPITPTPLNRVNLARTQPRRNLSVRRQVLAQRIQRRAIRGKRAGE